MQPISEKWHERKNQKRGPALAPPEYFCKGEAHVADRPFILAQVSWGQRLATLCVGQGTGS